MDMRAEFTDEQWHELMRAPGLAGLAVLAASPSGPIGLFKELGALGRSVAGGVAGAGADSLVGRLQADLRAIAERRATAPADERIPPAEMPARALEAVRKAAWLAGSRLPAEQVEPYKRWILDTAEQVARAAREGGLFGVGGVLVNEREREVLERLAGLLGLQRSV
jgi:hypothetical protein